MDPCVWTATQGFVLGCFQEPPNHGGWPAGIPDSRVPRLPAAPAAASGAVSAAHGRHRIPSDQRLLQLGHALGQAWQHSAREDADAGGVSVVREVPCRRRVRRRRVRRSATTGRIKGAFLSVPVCAGLGPGSSANERAVAHDARGAALGSSPRQSGHAAERGQWSLADRPHLCRTSTRPLGGELAGSWYSSSCWDSCMRFGTSGSCPAAAPAALMLPTAAELMPLIAITNCWEQANVSKRSTAARSPAAAVTARRRERRAPAAEIVDACTGGLLAPALLRACIAAGHQRTRLRNKQHSSGVTSFRTTGALFRRIAIGKGFQDTLKAHLKNAIAA